MLLNLLAFSANETPRGQCGKLFIYTLLAKVRYIYFIHRVVVIDNFCVF